jgi:methylated-DNA-protein-cysteine methyltransferase related protein
MDINPEDEALVLRIYEVVKQVPRGQVATYGWIAQVVGAGCDARLVGAALALDKDPEVPWQRVINAKGAISPRAGHEMDVQRALLQAEEVSFDRHGRINLARFGWRGPDPEWAAAHGYQTLPAQDEPFQPSLF